MASKDNNEGQDTADQNTPNSPEHAQYLKELSVRLSRNTKVRVATLAAIMIFIISSTWGLNEIFRVDDIKNELEVHRLEVERLINQNSILSHEHDNLSSSYEQIKKASKVPTLVHPVNWKPIIGRQIKFNWKYSKEQNPGFQNLVIELVKAGEENIHTRRFQLPVAGEQSKTFEFP